MASSVIFEEEEQIRKPKKKTNSKISKLAPEAIETIGKPMRDMMSDETTTEYPILITEENVKTYSDVKLLLTQYHGSMKRFSNERIQFPSNLVPLNSAHSTEMAR